MPQKLKWDALGTFLEETGIEFPWKSYKFIPQVLRDNDPFLIFKSLFDGIQQEFELHHTKISKLPDLQNPVLCNEYLLKYLKENVGFTGDLDHITDVLDENSLRKLIRLAVTMWVEKGTSDGIVNMIRFFTGRPALVKDWFEWIWLVGVNGQLLNGDYTLAPWIIGGTYGTYAEYLTNIRIEKDSTEPEERVAIAGLLELSRPMLENFEVAYPDFLDLFESTDRWSLISGGPLETDSDNRLVVTGPAMLECDWASAGPDMHFNTNIKTSQPAGTGTVIRYLFQATDENNCYMLQLEQSPVNTVTLWQRVLGVDVLLGIAAEPNLLDPDYYYGIQVTVTETMAGSARIRVSVDGYLKLNIVDNTYHLGKLIVHTAADCYSEFFEAFELPLDIEYVES